MRLLPRISYFLLLVLSCVSAKAASTARGECLPVSTEGKSFHCYSGTAVACADEDAEHCPDWAAQGECTRNANYMQSNCRKSCQTCGDGHGGVPQIAPDAASRPAVAARLAATARYWLAVTHENAPLIGTCTNARAECTLWAVRGRCAADASFMMAHCAAACHACL